MAQFPGDVQQVPGEATEIPAVAEIYHCILMTNHVLQLRGGNYLSGTRVHKGTSVRVSAGRVRACNHNIK